MWKTPIPFDLIEKMLPGDIPAQLIVVKLIARADRETGEFLYGYDDVASWFDKDTSRARRKMKKIRQATDKHTDMQATIKPTNKGTVGVWENYQSLTGMGQATDKQTDRKPTTNIDKEYKNKKNNTVSRTSRARQSSTASSLSCPSPAHGAPPPTPSPSQPSPRYTREFEEVRETYPLKKGKDVAHRERAKLDDYTKGLVKYAIQQYASETIKKKTKYIKHGSTRMRQKVYLDYQEDYDAQTQRNPQVTEKTRKLTPTEIRMQKPSKYGYGTVCYIK